jgi:hypothetical protein
MLAQGTLQGINTEVIIQGHRDFPSQHIATGPVHPLNHIHDIADGPESLITENFQLHPQYQCQNKT